MKTSTAPRLRQPLIRLQSVGEERRRRCSEGGGGPPCHCLEGGGRRSLDLACVGEGATGHGRHRITNPEPTEDETHFLF